RRGLPVRAGPRRPEPLARLRPAGGGRQNPGETLRLGQVREMPAARPDHDLGLGQLTLLPVQVLRAGVVAAYVYIRHLGLPHRGQSIRGLAGQLAWWLVDYLPPVARDQVLAHVPGGPEQLLG